MDKQYRLNGPIPDAFSELDPQKVGEELARILDEDGEITPEGLLRRAQDPSNYLHSAFEWDDKKAAEKYRRRQARDLKKRK